MLLFLLGACLKPAAVPQAPVRAPVLLAAVVESFERAEVQAAPPAVVERLAEVISARNLEPRVADAAAYTEAFESRRTTQARLDELADGGAELVLLVEVAPRFGAQVNGRYRWTVETELTLLPVAGPEGALTRAFDVPVHLVYAHEEEVAATQEAALVLAREVGALLDDWIGGR